MSDRVSHIWFGTSPPESPGALDVTRDEPFDPTKHGTPCSGWLLDTAPGERQDKNRRRMAATPKTRGKTASEPSRETSGHQAASSVGDMTR